MKYTPYDYQKKAEQWILDKPKSCLFLDMGLGKSVIALTAMKRLIDDCEITSVLVIAPKKVAETTWSTEAEKWDHLKGLRIQKVLGSEKQRVDALHQTADIYVLGRDNFVWLVNRYEGELPFDVMIIDELTSFKNSSSLRFKAMRIAAPSFQRIIGLTGTPAPNGLVDLWAEMYCVDQGERLGRYVTKYRDIYFWQKRWNNIVIRYDIKKGCDAIIRSKISDICLSMQAKDYLQLPDIIYHDVKIELSDEVKKKYKEFERDSVLEFKNAHPGEETNIMAQSAAGLMNKLSQYANGAVYDDDGVAHTIHSEKTEQLKEIVEAANGNSVLVFYQFKHDIPGIEKMLKGYKVRKYEGADDLNDWNAGKIDVLLAYPMSTAYGLNMQQGGHYIIWFGTGWNLELYEQANARLHRQGQSSPVQVYKLICSGTVDERANAALEAKDGVQAALMDGLKSLLNEYTNLKNEEDGKQVSDC